MQIHQSVPPQIKAMHCICHNALLRKYSCACEGRNQRGHSGHDCQRAKLQLKTILWQHPSANLTYQIGQGSLHGGFINTYCCMGIAALVRRLTSQRIAPHDTRNTLLDLRRGAFLRWECHHHQNPSLSLAHFRRWDSFLSNVKVKRRRVRELVFGSRNSIENQCMY